MHHTIWSVIISTLLPYVIAIVVALAIILVMTYFSRKKYNTAYIRAVVTAFKIMFGEKFGEKSDAVFDTWLECLDKVQKGEWTEQVMLDEFIKLITTMKDVTITEDDKNKIKDITAVSVKMLHADPAVSKMNLLSIKLN